MASHIRRLTAARLRHHSGATEHLGNRTERGVASPEPADRGASTRGVGLRSGSRGPTVALISVIDARQNALRVAGIPPLIASARQDGEMHLADAIDAVRPSVVQIRVEEARTEPYMRGESTPIGTGFIVTTAGHILTARHVVEAADDVISEGGRLLSGLAVPNLAGPIQIRGSFELIETRVVALDERHDLALLQVITNPFASGRTPGIHRTPDGGVGVNALWGLASLNIDRPRDGESVAVAGYPLAEPAMLTTSGHIASAWGLDVRRIIPPGAPEWLSIPDSQDSYLVDAAVNPGNSGGPVFRTYTADIIAVCVAFRIAQAGTARPPSFMYNSGLAVAVPIQYGVELLRANLPNTTGPDPEDGESPESSE